MTWTHLILRNLELNDLGGPEHQFIRSDANQFLAELKKYDDRIRAQQDEVTRAVRQFAEATTEEEWEALRKLNTGAMKDFAAVLNAI